MEELGKIHQLIIHFMGHNLTFNLETIVMTWIVILGLLVFGVFTARKKSRIPGPMQVLGELIVKQLFSLAESSLEKDVAKKYSPLICALFMFLVISNSLGVIPPFAEPTKDLNTPLGLGVMGFCIAHYVGIRKNVVGEIAKIISISFRLFGNILGGSIIILVVSYLTFNIFLPPFLNAFFGLFVGTIQAFVFTMLTVVYISMQVN